jgi:DNA-binding transcriptional ArsR family regulator
MNILMGKGFPVDTDTLRRTHLLITGVSGSGKSYRLRVLAEELAAVMPVWIFDVEGEYFTLREKFPFLLFGENGDAPMSVGTAAVLARKMLEWKRSAIFDLSSLDVEQQHAWMREFINSLMAAPRELWSPIACLVDEAHVFAPEKGEGVSEALTAMKNLCSRGRKRGIFVVLATQRLSKLANNCASEMQNYLVGRVTLTNDQERAAKTLGVSTRKAERAAFYHDIKVLRDHNFYGQGIAISSDRTMLHPIEAKTTHLRPGDIQDIKPATPAEIRAFLPQLSNLAGDAKKLAEAGDGASSAELQALRKQLADVMNERHITLGAYRSFIREAGKLLETANFTLAQFEERQGGLQSDSDITPLSEITVPDILAAAERDRGRKVAQLARDIHSNGTKAKAAEEARETPEERAQNKLLAALRSAEDTGFESLSRTWLAVVAQISPNSSSYRKYVSRLEQAGYIAYPVPGEIALTPAGREVADRLPHRRFAQSDLLASFEKLFKPARYRIMQALATERGSQWVTREQLAEASEQSVNSSAYREHMSALRELGLIEIGNNSTVRVDPFLFVPQAVAR